MRKPSLHVWTYEEIQQIGQFGEDKGWFYGFVRGDGKLMFGEIFPGYGVAAQFPYPWWSPITWCHAVRDVLFYRPGVWEGSDGESD